MDKVLCKCGCGTEIPKYDSRGRERKFKRCHQFLTKTALKNRALAKTGDKNPMWVGDDVKYRGVHDWVKRRLQKPEVCDICKINPPRDLANKNHKYRRRLKDWFWLCGSCHNSHDGKVLNFKHMQRKNVNNIDAKKVMRENYITNG